MGSVLKGVGCFIVFLVVLVAGGIGTAYHYRGTFLQRGAEKLLTDYLKTPVSLGTSEIKASDGYFAFRDIKIKNFADFSDGDLFTIGALVVQIDPETPGDEPIRIKKLLFENINLLYEYKSGTSNFMKFIKNTGIHRVEKNINAGGEPSAVPYREPENGQEIVLENFTFKSSKITVIVDGKTFTIPLPEIESLNLGQNRIVDPEGLGQLLLKSIPKDAWRELDNAKKALIEAGAKDAAEIFDELAGLRK